MPDDKDKRRIGPTRREHQFRLVVSLVGLLVLAGLLTKQGLSLAILEPVLIGLAFFGGSAVWSALALRRR